MEKVTPLQKEKFAPGTYGIRMQEIEGRYWPAAERAGVPYNTFKRRLLKYVREGERNVDYIGRQMVELEKKHEREMDQLREELAKAQDARMKMAYAMTTPPNKKVKK